MSLVVGLGNPGERYARTRHNVGWRVLDELVRRWNARPFETGLLYQVWRAERGTGTVDLMKPQTFMNLSGEAVSAWMVRHGLEASAMLVIADDVYLPLGYVRLRAAGSTGGHRGLESIGTALSRSDFARLRVGVGAVGSGAELREHVLEEFDEAEDKQAQEAIAMAADAADVWWSEGIGAAMNRFNRRVRKEVSES